MVDTEKIEDALDYIRPALQRDGGDVQLIEITPEGVVKVKLVGACGSCPMSMVTLKRGVEVAIKQRVPEVVAVEAV